jgi:hypothetical protein
LAQPGLQKPEKWWLSIPEILSGQVFFSNFDQAMIMHAEYFGIE